APRAPPGGRARGRAGKRGHGWVPVVRLHSRRTARFHPLHLARLGGAALHARAQGGPARAAYRDARAGGAPMRWCRLLLLLLLFSSARAADLAEAEAAF